eukprot:gb/GEZN01007476.1/.p1 GENE.gb/GEZN01007476.1/~~gb/GEZN01007476.1/.p1  ORF type:complete len:463 (-),score=61.95 gb/GEZN01007476.1/:82-1470(-)
MPKPECVSLREGALSDHVEPHPLLAGFRAQFPHIRSLTTKLEDIYLKPLDPPAFRAEVNNVADLLSTTWRNLTAQLEVNEELWKDVTDVAIQETSTTHKNQNVSTKISLQQAFLQRMKQFYQREKELEETLLEAIDNRNKSARVLALVLEEEIMAINKSLPSVPQVQASLGRLRIMDIQIQLKNRFLFVVPGSRVRAELSHFLLWLAKQLKSQARQLSDLELAGRTYMGLLSIHPFNDGNGRTAVALMMFVLTHRRRFPRLLLTSQDIRMIRFSPIPKDCSIAGAAEATNESQLAPEDVMYVFCGAMYRTLNALSSLFPPKTRVLQEVVFRKGKVVQREFKDIETTTQQAGNGMNAKILASKLSGQELQALQELVQRASKFKNDVRDGHPIGINPTSEEYEERMNQRLAKFHANRNGPDVHWVSFPPVEDIDSREQRVRVHLGEMGPENPGKVQFHLGEQQR